MKISVPAVNLSYIKTLFECVLRIIYDAASYVFEQLYAPEHMQSHGRSGRIGVALL